MLRPKERHRSAIGAKRDVVTCPCVHDIPTIGPAEGAFGDSLADAKGHVGGLVHHAECGVDEEPEFVAERTHCLLLVEAFGRYVGLARR